MTKDQALLAARAERDKTSIPQAVGMRADGSWYVQALTGRKLDTIERFREQVKAAGGEWPSRGGEIW